MPTISNLVVNLTAKTDEFYRRMNEATSILNKLQSQFQMGFSYARLRTGINLVSQFVDSFTRMHEAIRKGENAWISFATNLPLVGRMLGSVVDLIDELTGKKKLEEYAAWLDSMTDSILSMHEKITRSMEKLKSEREGVPTELIAAETNYYNLLKQINSLEKSIGYRYNLEADSIWGKELERLRQRAEALRNYEIETYKYLEAKREEQRIQEELNRRTKEYRHTLELFAAGVKEKIKTPFERLSEYLDNLKKVLEEGLLTLEEYWRAVREAYSEYNRGVYGRTMSGTAEAIQIGQVSVQGLSLNAAAETNQLLRRQTTLQQMMLHHLSIISEKERDVA